MAGKLTSRIPLIIEQLDDKLLEGVMEVAERTAEGARERVPVESGALRDAIHVEAEDDWVAVVAGNTEAFYGHIVENGSIRTPARPFLLPAFEVEREQLDETIAEALEDL